MKRMISYKCASNIIIHFFFGLPWGSVVEVLLACFRACFIGSGDDGDFLDF